MKRESFRGLRLLVPSALILLACACSRPAEESAASAGAAPKLGAVAGRAGAGDIARFLAGKPVRHGDRLARLQQSPEYAAHAREMVDLWSTASNLRLARMSDWSRRNIVPATNRERTLFYPFGGPDLLYADVLFEHVHTKVLMGLEPAGSTPDLGALDDTRVLAALPAYRRALRYHLLAGYFDTKDMQSELSGPVLGGVTPMLLTTVAMMGGTVDSVGALPSNPGRAVEVRYHNRSGAARSAVYLCCDLSNKGFAGCRPLLDSFGRGATLFKSASYLPHDESFSAVREYFLARSSAILQDDSGIPLRFFPSDRWRIQCFGVYQQPIPLFARYSQPDLRAIYQNSAATRLPFGYGYHYLPESANLLLAVRK